MSSDDHSYQIPHMPSVSPLDSRPYSWGDPTAFEPQSEKPAPRYSEVSIEDHNVTTAPSQFMSTQYEYEDGSTLRLNDQGSTGRKQMTRSIYVESKNRRYFPTWTIVITTLISTIFTIYYSFAVLVTSRAVPLHLQSSPGTTVLIINVLSHIVAFLVWCLFSDTFEALRWSLACRAKGLGLTSFLALSRATPLSGVIYLCKEPGIHQVWAIWRVLLMGLITLMGLVLITDVNFKNVYTDAGGQDRIKAVAGLAPLNTEVLQVLPRDILSLFATTYTMGFITDPKFVASVPPISCSGDDCMAIFLPGGLDTARRDTGGATSSNTSLFDGTNDGDYAAIVIENAPGIHLEYDALDANYTFPPENCTLYEGSLRDGLQICLRADGPSMIAGWSMCPTPIKNLFACSTNTTWMKTTDWGVKVSQYRRFATVAYDRLNISILTIESIGPPTQLEINPNDFKQYHDIILGPIPNTLPNSTSPEFSGDAVSYTAQYALGWLMRLYKDRYEDYHKGGLDILKGFLSISFQFSTLAWTQLSFDTLPDNMHVTASLQKVSYRALIDAWSVWAFGGMALIVIAWSVSCLAWLHFWGPSSPNMSHFPEMDIVSKSHYHPAGIDRSSNMSVRERRDAGGSTYVVDSQEVQDLGKLMRRKGLGNGMSKEVIGGLKGMRIYCGGYRKAEGRQMVLIVTERDKVEPLREKEEYS